MRYTAENVWKWDYVYWTHPELIGEGIERDHIFTTTDFKSERALAFKAGRESVNNAAIQKLKMLLKMAEQDALCVEG